MGVKQISVFLENKTGRLGEVTRILGEKNIDISALSVADTTHFGILRLIVNKPEEADACLKQAGFTVTMTEVLAIGVDDCPGALGKALDVLTNQGVEIEYIYAFVGKTLNKALVIMKVADITYSSDLLAKADVTVLSDDQVYSL